METLAENLNDVDLSIKAFTGAVLWEGKYLN